MMYSHHANASQENNHAPDRLPHWPDFNRLQPDPYSKSVATNGKKQEEN